MTTRPVPSVPGIAHGGDHSPEQWPEEVWAQYRRLTRDTGADSVGVGTLS